MGFKPKGGLAERGWITVSDETIRHSLPGLPINSQKLFLGQISTSYASTTLSDKFVTIRYKLGIPIPSSSHLLNTTSKGGGTGVGVGVGTRVGVGVGMLVGLGMALGVAMGVDVGVGVAVGIGDGVGSGIEVGSGIGVSVGGIGVEVGGGKASIVP